MAESAPSETSWPGGIAGLFHADFPAAARRVILARMARAFGQGVWQVDFALYLHTLGWTAPAIGALYTAALAVNAFATALMGSLVDRHGSRRFLLSFELAQMAAALLAFFSTTPAALIAATLVAGYGRGANGAAGPFAPAEQAWLSHSLPARRWGESLSLNTALAVAGMGFGALAAALPALWADGHITAADYRWLFLLPLAGALLGFALLWRARETPPLRDASGSARKPAPLTPAQRANLRHLSVVNGLNGLGVGLVGPLMAYWFLLKFGVGPGKIGTVMALGFFLTAALALAAGRLSMTVGVVETVARLRLAGLGLLLLIPLMPLFWLAAALYVVRMAVNRGTVGPRQALALSLLPPERRGLAAMTNSLSMQVPRAFGPLIAGVFFHYQWLILPFILATILQGAYILLFRHYFRRWDPAVE